MVHISPVFKFQNMCFFSFSFLGHCFCSIANRLFAKGDRAVDLDSTSFAILFVCLFICVCFLMLQQRAILSSVLTVRDLLYHQLMYPVDRCISYLQPTT